MEKEQLLSGNKSCKTYFETSGTRIYFSGDFDSGNLEKVQQLAPLTYRITPGFDRARQSTRKTFFHFRCQGFTACCVRFQITRVYLLQQLIKFDSSSDSYRPVARVLPGGEWEKISDQVKIYYNLSDEPELAFNYQFQDDGWVEFAFTYPYPYARVEQIIKEMEQQCQNNPNIYFHQEVLCKTSPDRNVRVITVTDKSNCSTERQGRIEGIFVETSRPFRIDRPRVVISGRVHPGQTPASFCMEGILKFLLHSQDPRAAQLRKNFHFILIPILNPEGVYEGLFRTDLAGENLNRLYAKCDSSKHPSIWSVRKYVQALGRVDFFFDLHAHPSKKGFFIYGNAFEDFIEQVEAQMFSRVIQYNCPYFETPDCVYTEKAMNSKDKHDKHTKQGCARVYYHRHFAIIHSYTVECGYFAPTRLNPYPPPAIPLPAGSSLQWQQFNLQEYKPESYMMLGKSILVSLLDLLHLNPHSRISNSQFKSMANLRQFTAQKIFNEVERFRFREANCYRKIKDINTLIEQSYYQPRLGKYGLTTLPIQSIPRKNTLTLGFNLFKSQSLDRKDRKSKEEDGKDDNKEKGKEKQENKKRQTIKTEQPSQSEEEELKELIAALDKPNPIKEQPIGGIHHQLLSSFSKYNKSATENTPNKQGLSPKKTTLAFYKKDKAISNIARSPPSPLKTTLRRLESEVLDNLLQAKLKKPSPPLPLPRKVSSFLRSQGLSNTRLPSISKDMPLSSSLKHLK